VSDGPVDFGRYELTDLLARGGMAEVYRARARGVSGFEKVLVIKRILPELVENPQFVEMFVNEAKISVSLSHPNIVQVFDLGEESGAYYIAMEYVAGTDLGIVVDRLRRAGRRMPWPLASYVGGEVAKALDYAHRRTDDSLRPLSIVHRDVSPQNVLLGWEGEVKLTDFGVAKARLAAQEVTDVGIVKGKYAYMAPEQATGEPVDHRADLFSLGTLLYEAISGRNPFVGRSTYETLRRIRRGQAPPLAQAAEDVPEPLAALVDRMVRPTAAERPESAGRFFDDWTRCLHRLGVRAGATDLAAFLGMLSTEGLLDPSGRESERPGRESEVTRPGRSTRPPSAGVASPGGPGAPMAPRPGEMPTGAGGRRGGRGTGGWGGGDDDPRETPPDAAMVERRVEQAMRRGGLSEADALLRKLLRMDGDAAGPADRARWHLLGARLRLAEREFVAADELLGRAKDLAQEPDDRPAPSAWELTLTTHELDVARGRAAAAVAGLATPARGPALELRRLLALARAHLWVGETEEAARVLDRIDQGRSLGDDVGTTLARHEVAFLVHLHRGALGAASSTAERAIEDAWAADRRHEAMRHAHLLGGLHLRTGDDRRAFGYLRTSYELARDAGIASMEWANLRALGCLDAVRFGARDGRALIEEALRDAERRGDLPEALAATVCLGHAVLALGDPDAARSWLADAAERGRLANARRTAQVAERGLRMIDAREVPDVDW